MTNLVKTVLDSLESGLNAALPYSAMKKYIKKNSIALGSRTIKLEKFRNIHIVAFGKAADSMTEAVDSILDVKSGIIVLPSKTKPIIKNRKFAIAYGSHPVPTTKSISAARKVIKFLESVKTDDFVIFLISGGGSAILSYPDGISISEKSKTTEILLKSGATIQEINCIRKHLSQIKGGRLVDHLPCHGCSLIMSDVQDDDMSSISSGCTYYDKTTFSDAFKIIGKYGLKEKIPKEVLKRINLGMKGKIPETPKKERIPNQIILSNKDCLAAIRKKLEKNGFAVKQIQMFGDIKDAIKKIKRNIPKKKKSALVFGGEVTVKVQGNGKGGRNQEMILRMLSENIIPENCIAVSIGTDGIDGNTDYAGAVSGARTNFSEMKKYIQNNDSNTFFKKYGGLVKTGPTHTNLMDIGLLLCQ